MEFRLYESSGFVADCPPFAESDDFDALRLWAVGNNDWKGTRQGAVIASDSGRFWYVSRSGSVREASDERGLSGGRSQAQKFRDRIDGTRPFTPKSAADLGYDYPPPERWQHQTIQVLPLSPSQRPKLKWFYLDTSLRSQKGVLRADLANVEDGEGRYERRGEGASFTAVFIDGHGGETILPLEGAPWPALNVSPHAAYRAVMHHYYAPERDANRGAYTRRSSAADVEDALEVLARPRGRGPQLSAMDRRAIEQHAVAVAMGHFDLPGYSVDDVGDYESYDLHVVTDADEVIKVEVKGTTGDGSNVVLTRNEVALHEEAHPRNALIIVRHIRLTHADDGTPVTSGGEPPNVFMPWAVERGRLNPIAYDYKTGL